MKTNFFKIILSAILLGFTLSSIAQKSGKIEGGINVNKFPEVSFVFHSYDYKLLNNSDFIELKEQNHALKFNVQRKDTVYADKPQTTIILWEDMSINGVSQYNFTKEVLIQFLKKSDVNRGDKFQIFTFNRRENTPSVLTSITDGYVSDKVELANSILKYKRSLKSYSKYPNRSDLYSALRESLDSLSHENGVKSIILFTAGHPMESSGADSDSQVLLKAQSLHIPIYIFQYYRNSGIATSTEGFANSTYGEFNSYKDEETAAKKLIDLYPQIKERTYGNDYIITYISNSEKGDEAKVVTLTVAGEEYKIDLYIPSFSIIEWLKENPFITTLIIIVILILIVVACIVIVKIKRKIKDQQRNLKEIQEQNIKDRQEAENKHKQLIDNINKSKEEEEYKRLQRLMSNKGMYPRLIYQLNGKSYTYEVVKPIVNIGREVGNDIVFQNPRVSRQHAQIVFAITHFEVVDKGSTNKVVVNGSFVTRAILKDGDIIGLGDVYITYRL